MPLTDRAREIAREAAVGKRPEHTAPRKRPHMLRHYCASQWLRAGLPINQVAEWLGDDPRTVLKVYAHVLGERQTIGALRRLNEIASGPSQDPRPFSESVNSPGEGPTTEK